jgi:hypothetical protein
MYRMLSRKLKSFSDMALGSVLTAVPKGRGRASLKVEELEARENPTSTLFIDFAEDWGNSTTTILDTGGDQTFYKFSDFTDPSYGFTGPIDPLSDTVFTTFQNQVGRFTPEERQTIYTLTQQLVQNAFGSLDVNVVLNPSRDGAVFYDDHINRYLSTNVSQPGERDTFLMVGRVTLGGTAIAQVAQNAPNYGPKIAFLGLTGGGFENNSDAVLGTNARDDFGYVDAANIDQTGLTAQQYAFRISQVLVTQAMMSFGAMPRNNVLPANLDQSFTEDFYARNFGLGYLNRTEAGVIPFFTPQADATPAATPNDGPDQNMSFISRYPMTRYYYQDPDQRFIGIPGPGIRLRENIDRDDGNVATNFFFYDDAEDVYAQLSNPTLLGVKANTPEYVTGTGSDDRIVITRIDAATARVEVTPYIPTSTAAGFPPYVNPTITPGTFSTAAQEVTYTYTINLTSQGILIRAGAGNDQITIDSALNVPVRIDGGEGADSLVINGNGAQQGSYIPSISTSTSLDGTTSFNSSFAIVTPDGGGLTQISLEGFELTQLPGGGLDTDRSSNIRVENFVNFTFQSPGGTDLITVVPVAGTLSRVTGTVNNGQIFIPLDFNFVNNLIFDLSSNDTAGSNDVVTFNTPLRVTGLQNFSLLTGEGDDQFIINYANLGLPTPGGSFSWNAGSGTDTLSITGDAGYTLTNSFITSTAGGSLNLFGTVEVANLTGGASNNTFAIVDWTGTSTNINGAGGFDSMTILDNQVDNGITFNLNGNFNQSYQGSIAVNLLSFESYFLDARGGNNSLAINDFSSVAYGNSTPFSGVVYAPSSGTGGQIRFATPGATNPLINFANINGDLSYNSDANGSGGVDALTVLGISSSAAGSTNGEFTADNGSDDVTINADSVVMTNASLGNLRTLRFTASGSTFGVSSLSVNTGNESGTTGDTIRIRSIPGLPIFIDGGAPTLKPGDRLVVDTGGSATRLENVGGNVRRIVFVDDGSSVNFVNIEDAGGGFSSYAVAFDSGGPGIVQIFELGSGTLRRQFAPYGNLYTNGIKLASGDFNGDGIADIVTATGIGAPPHIKIFDGVSGSMIGGFFAYDSRFSGGVSIAVGDVNGDGVSDIVTGAGPGGGPHVKVFSGAGFTEIASFFAYIPSATMGVNVAVGDVDGDGFLDVITGTGFGFVSHVQAFSGRNNSVLRSFFAFDLAYTGGVTVAAGDIDGDGLADIIATPGAQGIPLVSVFKSGSSAPAFSFFVNNDLAPGTIPTVAAKTTGGLRISLADKNLDGKDDILVVRGPGSRPRLTIYDSSSESILSDFFLFDTTFGGGVYVASNNA